MSSRNSVSPPSESSIADSVMGKGRSGFTGPITVAEETWTSWPCSRFVGSTRPVISTLDSIRAFLSDSKHSSPTTSLFATHWTWPVESRTTMNHILLEPRALWIHPLRTTSLASWEPAVTSPIQYSFPIAPMDRLGPSVMNPRLLGIYIGGSDGVRTRDRPVKSRVLYLTKLQTRLGIGRPSLTTTDAKSFHQT